MNGNQAPTPNEIPWIEHHGDACPVPTETEVEIELQCGETLCGRAGGYRWNHVQQDLLTERLRGNILRYRVLRPVHPAAQVYRIKFPDPNTESYFYTERSYRILESRLRAQSAELELSKADAKAARAGCCTVCWTNSFEPCEESDEGAVAYKDGTGFVRCQHCYMIEGFRKCKAELERVREALKIVEENRAGILSCLVKRQGQVATMRNDRDQLESDLATATAQLAEREAQVAELEKNYKDLIMRVGNKYDGETRHQTAARYISEAERGHEQASQPENGNAATSKPQP